MSGDALVSSKVAAERAGVSERQLDYWVRAGWVHPEQNGTGSGTQRRWSSGEVDVAEFLGIFSRLFHRLGTVADAVREGPCFTLYDRDYEIDITLRAREFADPAAGRS